MKENRYLEDLAAGLSRVIGLIKVAIDAPDRAGPLMEYRRLLDDLARLDQRYARKENQLFPMLEAHHFTGPSQVMWAIHDDIRAKIRAAREKLDAGDGPGSMAEVLDVLGPIREMIYKEEHILFPACLEMLSEAEWKKIQAGDEEIGFPWMTPDEGWPGVASAPAAEPEVYGAPAVEAVPAGPIPDLVPLKTGRLTLEQIDLIFRHLPVDITFVDENDRVAYYSDGDRIFPRSPAIIGREVRNCHPPKSVHVVNRILDDFKSGARDSAAFWIQLKGKFIYIRYFAVHDEKGRYKGCLEVSQEVSDIKALEGQKRLLD
jgi:hypothetical protein